MFLLLVCSNLAYQSPSVLYQTVTFINPHIVHFYRPMRIMSLQLRTFVGLLLAGCSLVVGSNVEVSHPSLNPDKHTDTDTLPERTSSGLSRGLVLG